MTFGCIHRNPITLVSSAGKMGNLLRPDCATILCLCWPKALLCSCSFSTKRGLLIHTETNINQWISTLVFANKRIEFPMRQFSRILRCGKFHGILSVVSVCVRAPPETDHQPKDFYRRPTGIEYLMKWPDAVYFHSSSSGSGSLHVCRSACVCV